MLIFDLVTVISNYINKKRFINDFDNKMQNVLFDGIFWEFVIKIEHNLKQKKLTEIKINDHFLYQRVSRSKTYFVVVVNFY